MPPNDLAGLQSLRELVRSPAVLALLDRRRITSVGIAMLPWPPQEDVTPELLIQFTVDPDVVGDDAQMRAAMETTDSAPIPDHFEVAGRRVATDVIERRFKFERADRGGEPRPGVRWQDPVRPGISVGNSKPGMQTPATTGTLGAIVFDRDGTPLALTNAHVFSGETAFQPARRDCTPEDRDSRLGRVVRRRIDVDCAVAAIEVRGYSREIPEVGVAPSRAGGAQLGCRVVKVGRTTGVTKGLVRRVEVTAKYYLGDDFGVQRLRGFEYVPDPKRPQDLCYRELSRRGDSGTLVLAADPVTEEATELAVGLHAAGEPSESDDEHAFACDLHRVLRELDVSLVPGPGRIET